MEEHVMFRSLKLKCLGMAFALLCYLLIGSAAAETPTCTITYGKDSYALGEAIEAHYKIDFAGEYSTLFVEWGIITNWDTGNMEPSDSFQELASLEGDLSFTPLHGEGAVPYFTLVDADGGWHDFWGDSVRIAGNVAFEPTCAVTFDKESYAAGETIKAHYSIDFSGACTALYAEWNIVTNWETGAIESGDSFQELTEMEGDLSFAPLHGEGAVLYFTVVDSDGKWYTLMSDPVRIAGKVISPPTIAVTFDKAVYAFGDTVNAHYKIDFEGEYTELYAEWNLVTDWETEEIESGGSSQKLTSLEGDLSFVPPRGEGVVLHLTLIEPSGKWHTLMSNPVQVTGTSAAAPVFAVAFDKEVYELGDTVNAHYKIDFAGRYEEIYAEWNVITDWETEEIQAGAGFQELTSLEGDLAFEANQGEGISLYLTLVETDGGFYSFGADPIRISVSDVVYLPKALTVIEKEAFKGAKFTRVVCPDGLISIGDGAFSGCTSLVSITIPDSVESISEDAFDGCTSLTTIIAAKGSEAEKYATFHNYRVSYLQE